MKTLTHARTYALYTFFFALFLFGCSTTELHTQSFIKESEYAKTLAKFDEFQKEFLDNGRGYIEKRYTMERYQRLQPSRDFLSAWFACLKPREIKIYTSNIVPSDDPLPFKEVQYVPAALADRGQTDLWHMRNPTIGFEEIPQDHAPFLRAVLCPIKFESHYDQGFGGDLIGGRQEKIRGPVTFLIFTFTLERNGSQRLLNMQKSEEYRGDDLTAFNAWYTRFGNAGMFALGGAAGLVFGH